MKQHSLHDSQRRLAAFPIFIYLRFPHHRDRFAVDLWHKPFLSSPRFRCFRMGYINRRHAFLPTLAKRFCPACTSAAPIHAATGMLVIRNISCWNSAQPLGGWQEFALLELAQHRWLPFYGCYRLSNSGTRLLRILLTSLTRIY